MGLNEAQRRERSEYLGKYLEITECSQRKPYVFVSYASDNWETVFKSAVVPMQKQYGLRVYADKAFDKVNDKWIVPMLRNIRGADVILAFVSQSYIESYACFLELLTAVNNKKQIVFVSLGEDLHLGDTTDLPNVERGVKNEILNQGGNIATNTNNTSNDLMRAMKSAYTSILTLLEQDALSKYDISDAFINFFRDASINRKTINDLGAVKDTISSISRHVFDQSLISGSASPKIPAASVPQAWQVDVPSADNNEEQARKSREEAEAREEAKAREKARIEAEQRMKAEAEVRVRREAEQKAREEAEKENHEEFAAIEKPDEPGGDAGSVTESTTAIGAKEEAELRIKAEAEARVRVAAEQKAREEAERKARKEAKTEEIRQKFKQLIENIKNKPEYRVRVSLVLGIIANIIFVTAGSQMDSNPDLWVALFSLSLIFYIVGTFHALKGLKSEKRKLSVIAIFLNGWIWLFFLLIIMFY